MELKPCPFCGSNANIVHGIQEKTYYAKCQNNNCRASICVHYGNRIRIHSNVIRAKEYLYGCKHTIKREEIARSLCVQKWNERQGGDLNTFCKMAYESFRNFVHSINPDGNIFFEDFLSAEDKDVTDDC